MDWLDSQTEVLDCFSNVSMHTEDVKAGRTVLDVCTMQALIHGHCSYSYCSGNINYYEQ